MVAISFWVVVVLLTSVFVGCTLPFPCLPISVVHPRGCLCLVFWEIVSPQCVCVCVCVCVSAHVELAAGLSGTVGESPVVAADPPANAPGQAAALPELSVILSTASLSQPRIIFQQGRPHQL